jgi:hypothetical protein
MRIYPASTKMEINTAENIRPISLDGIVDFRFVWVSGMLSMLPLVNTEQNCFFNICAFSLLWVTIVKKHKPEIDNTIDNNKNKEWKNYQERSIRLKHRDQTTSQTG